MCKWYHGSPNDFEEYDIYSESLNRTSNPVGIYLSPFIEDAKGHAGDEGYVYEVTTTADNPFECGKSQVTDRMIDAYITLLKEHTTYSSSYIMSVIIPEFIQFGTFPDIGGWLKTEVMKAGDYDSWKDNNHLAVFDPDKVVFYNKIRVCNTA